MRLGRAAGVDSSCPRLEVVQGRPVLKLRDPPCRRSHLRQPPLQPAGVMGGAAGPSTVALRLADTVLQVLDLPANCTGHFHLDPPWCRALKTNAGGSRFAAPLHPVQAAASSSA